MDEHSAANRATYDRIAGRYLENQLRQNSGNTVGFSAFGERFLAGLPTAALIGDLGCGPGVDAAWISAAGHRVLGLDLSLGMLSVAAPSGLCFVQGDLRHLPLRRSGLDGIWCVAALLHVPEPDTEVVLGEMRRTLRPGGTLALITALGGSSFFEEVPYAPTERRFFVYRCPERLRDQLRASGFTILEEERITHARPWCAFLARVTERHT